MKTINKHSRWLLALLLIVAGLAGAMAPQTAAAKNKKPPIPGDYVIGYPKAISPTSVLVKWTPATDKTTKPNHMAYQVEWRKVTESKWSSIPNRRVMGVLEDMITDLEPDTEYEINLNVLGFSGVIVYYGVRRVKTPPVNGNGDPRPGNYKNDRCTVLGPHAIRVEWTPGKGYTTLQSDLRYQVTWRKKVYGQNWNFGPIQENLFSYVVEGIEDNTTYEVEVILYEKNNSGASYGIREFTTPSAVNDAEAPEPKGYVAGYPKATSPTTIGVKWNAATDNVTPQEKLRYRVAWKKASWTGEWSYYDEDRVPRGSTQWVIADLEENTKYKVDVRVMDNVGNVKWYGEKEVTTPPATGGKDTEAPEKGTYVGDPVVTASTITLKWTPGKDNKTPTDKLRYRFIWMKVTDKEWTSSVPDGAPLTILPQNITEYSFESLASGTAYWVNVGAYDEAGNYVWYGAKKVTTLTENTIAIKLTPEKMEVGANQQSKEVGLSCDKAFRITGIGTMSDWIANFSSTSEEVKTQHSVTFNVKANPGAERTGKLVINTTRGSLTLIVTQAAKSAEEGNKAPEPQGYVGTPVVTSSTIKLKWNPATDDHTAQKDLRYMVVWKRTSDSEWETSSSEADMPKNMTEYEIKGLEENTEYRVYVGVMDEAGAGVRYDELKITTLSKGTKPDDPKPDDPKPNPGVVSKPVSSVTLDRTAVTVNGNLESFLLKAVVLPADADNPGLKWSSSNPSVATVVAIGGEAPEPSGKLLRSGPVTGRTVAVHIHSKGKAVITAQTVDGSNKSATCQVDVLATVGNMEAASGTRIYTADGMLHLTLPTATRVEIYTLLGVRLRTLFAPAGDTSVALPQGLYVVKAGHTVQKVRIE